MDNKVIEEICTQFKSLSTKIQPEYQLKGITAVSEDSCSCSSKYSEDVEESTEDESEKHYRLIKKSTLKVIKDVPMYFPSKEMKSASILNFTSYSIGEYHNAIIKTYLKDLKLNENNIHVVYKMLLEMEDITCMTEYVSLIQKDVILNYSHGEYWISLKNCPKIEEVVVPMVDEIVLMKKKSVYECLTSYNCYLEFQTDILLPDTHEKYPQYYGTTVVRQIKRGRLYFRLSAAKGRHLPTEKYDIIFRSKRYPLRYQYHAMYILGLDEKLRRYLFPTPKPNKGLVDLPQLDSISFNKSIATNPEQMMAVKNIYHGFNINAPFIIFGPPGTGKTTVVVESILQLLLGQPNSRILLTAGSNSACDTIALQLCKYIEEYLPFCQQTSLLLRLYSKAIFKKNKNPIDARLLKYSNCTPNHHYPSINEIRNHHIIVTTLCTVGKLATCDLGSNDFFTHIFIDEAGASSIPEALVAVVNVKSHRNCRLILSGDHKQLGPILKSERAAELGLGQSLMEHLLKLDCYAIDDNGNYDRTVQARLRRNYRSHPEILRLYNHLFYNDELIAAANAENVNLAAKWCKLPNPKFPVIFQAVHGVTEKRTPSPSSFNRLEIEVVMWFLRRLLNDGINGQIVNESDIGIITPYKQQSILIKEKLKNHSWLGVECGSVENFQGSEKQIIIVSLVKSFVGLGFVCQSKRLNVVLSRPKSLLILIGNPLTLKRNAQFGFILSECERNGTFMRAKQTGK